MARVKLKFPQKIHFTTYLDIRITDINYGGHLGNDAVLSLIHEARVRLLAEKGFSEDNIDGVGIIMTDAVINYSSEGHYGDKLKIDMAVDDVTNKGCDIYYRLVNIKTEKEIVKAKTNILFYNYSSKKIARTPEKFIKAFSLYKN